MKQDELSFLVKLSDIFSVGCELTSMSYTNCHNFMTKEKHIAIIYNYYYITRFSKYLILQCEMNMNLLTVPIVDNQPLRVTVTKHSQRVLQNS